MSEKITISIHIALLSNLRQKNDIFYFSNTRFLVSFSVSLESLYFTDAATVETVTPVISQSWIGQTVKLTCKADGVPTPTLSWKNPSGKVIKKVTELTNTVDVVMSSDQDFGNYTCEATNDVNTDTRTLLVQQISKLNIYCSSIVFYDTHTPAIRKIITFFCHSSVCAPVEYISSPFKVCI